MKNFLGKTLAFFQKADGYIALAVFAILLIYGLGMGTACANCVYYQDTYYFYKDVQLYNDIVVYCALAGIFFSLFYRILRNDIRKIYYPSNFVWSFLYVLAAILIGAIVFYCVNTYKNQFATIPFDTANAYFESHGQAYRLNPDDPVFLLGYLAAILVMLSALPVFGVALQKILKAKKPVASKDVPSQEGGKL
jgi:hypothetical protein